MSRSVVTALIVLVAVGFPLSGPAANGGKSKRISYRGTLAGGESGARGAQFDAELEPLLFRLGTVKDRYHVVRIRIRNDGDRDLALSATADRVEVHFRNGASVSGILSLGSVDGATWDGLPADLRAAIAYPPLVERGEEESIFVFIPRGDVTGPPAAFRYLIATVLGRPVLIRDVTSAALQ
jgi:hypothetical protein